MKFLLDVHLSLKLVNRLNSLNYPSIHVNQILNKSETTDSEISNYADEHNFIVVTKDQDFKDSFFIKKTPKKLVKINLGNISNIELIDIFCNQLENIKILDSKESNFILEIDSKNTLVTFL